MEQNPDSIYKHAISALGLEGPYRSLEEGEKDRIDQLVREYRKEVDMHYPVENFSNLDPEDRKRVADVATANHILNQDSGSVAGLEDRLEPKTSSD